MLQGSFGVCVCVCVSEQSSGIHVSKKTHNSLRYETETTSQLAKSKQMYVELDSLKVIVVYSYEPDFSLIL